MSLRKILAQKLKNPKTKEWVETSYVAIDDATGDDPVIYTHGTLADNDVIEGRHIQENAIISSHISNEAVETNALADLSVTRPKIYNNAINSAKLANGAVTKSKIDWSTIFTVTERPNKTFKIKIGE